jgi:hypothetical protein
MTDSSILALVVLGDQTGTIFVVLHQPETPNLRKHSTVCCVLLSLAKNKCGQ